MKLNKTLAVALHRAMWTDMKTELGDNPPGHMREDFKKEWIKKYFPNERVRHNCFLCEYTFSSLPNCTACPIRWPEGDCCGHDFSYDKAPISEILALPEKDLEPTSNGPKYIFDETEAVRAYYTYREELLSKASGLPASVSIEGHIKAIRKKAVEDDSAKKASFYIAIAKASDAFKKYAEEQKASIFHTLAEASGLSADNESVKAHISEIKDKAKNDGRFERSKEIFRQLSVHSGVTKDDWSVYDHAMAIKRNASNEKELGEARKELNCALGSLNLYRSTLSYESNLPSSAPIADHIKQIREYAFTEGKRLERERIMDKIGEMLNDKSTGKKADS